MARPNPLPLSPLWLFVSACGGLVLGAILFASGFRLPGGPDFLLVPAALVVLPLLFCRVKSPQRRLWVYPLLGALTALHGIRFTRDPVAAMERAHPGPEPELCGWVSAVESPRWGSYRYQMALAETNGPNWKADGFFANLESAKKWEGLTVGDTLRVRGRIESTLAITNLGYRHWLLSQGVAFRVRVPAGEDPAVGEKLAGRLPPWQSPVFFKAIYQKAIDHMGVKFARTIGEPADSLSLGLVTGLKSGLPPEIVDDFRKTGTLHVLAVSGSHAVVLAALFYSLFRFFGLGRRVAMALLLFGIFPPYLFLTGFQVSIVRTYVMAVVLFGLQWAGREVKPQVILALAFLGVALADPGQLSSVSFQLSFAAVWGMGTATEILRLRGLTGTVPVYLGVSLGAQAFTLPFLIYHFGWVNPLSLFYNTLIVFLIPLSLIYSLVLWLCPFEVLNAPLGHTLALTNHLTFNLIHQTRRDFDFSKFGLAGKWLPATVMAAGVFGVCLLLLRWGRGKEPPLPRIPGLLPKGVPEG